MMIASKARIPNGLLMFVGLGPFCSHFSVSDTFAQKNKIRGFII